MSKNVDLIEDYRNVVTNEILNNKVIVDVLSKGEYTLENADELLWTRVFPNEFDPDTITDTESYIFYDIDESVSPIESYLQMTLYFWVFTHKSIAKYNGDISESKNRLRNDIIVRELKKTFAPKRNMGISKNKFLYNKIYTQSNSKFTARLVAFKIIDFSDKIRYKSDGEKWD